MKLTRWVPGMLGMALMSVELIAGCGVKSAPIPPEMTRPERITDLRASSVPDGIRLSWQRPTHYVGGHTMRDLGGFVILRGEGSSALEPLVEIPVTDQERFSVQHAFSYVDGETSLGRTYHYEIVARTMDGYNSEPSNEAAATRVKPATPPNPDTFQLPRPSPLPTNLP